MQQKEIARLTELAEKFKHHPTKVSMAKSSLSNRTHGYYRSTEKV
jgi:ATP-binding cassette subfamily F protein 3